MASEESGLHASAPTVGLTQWLLPHMAVFAAGVAVLLLSLRSGPLGGDDIGMVLGAITATLLMLVGIAGVWWEVSRWRKRRAGAAEFVPLLVERESFTAILERMKLPLIQRWSLAAAAILSAWPRASGGLITMAIMGVLLGFLLYVRRPKSAKTRDFWHQWLPWILALGFSVLLSATPGVMAPLLLPAASALGVWIGRQREKLTGPPLRLVQHDWGGVDAVGVAGGTYFFVGNLRDPVTRREAREFRKLNPDLTNQAMRARVTAVSVVAWLMPLGLLALATGIGQEIQKGTDNMVSQLLGMAGMGSIMLVAWIILIWWGLRARTRISTPKDHLRYLRFAEVNGLAYDPGPVVDGAGNGTLTRVMVRKRDNAMMFANREANGSSATETNSYFGGVCVVRIGTMLPNIVLRSGRNRAPAFSSYTAPVKSQRLSLEGDFDRHFELFCPKGYERDALYLFTPDVMAWLIDDVGDFDVELIDDHLYLRSRSDLVTRDPASWQRIALALNALETRIAQWARWRDDRLESGSIAARLALDTPGGRPRVGASGQRLRLSLGFGGVLHCHVSHPDGACELGVGACSPRSIHRPVDAKIPLLVAATGALRAGSLKHDNFAN